MYSCIHIYNDDGIIQRMHYFGHGWLMAAPCRLPQYMRLLAKYRQHEFPTSLQSNLIMCFVYKYKLMIACTTLILGNINDTNNSSGKYIYIYIYIYNDDN